MALEYVNDYLNGTDSEVKKKFVDEKVHPDVQPLFQLLDSADANAEKLNNPKVIESTDFTDADGEKDQIVLIQGEQSSNDKSEIIVLIKDEKIGWILTNSDKETFDEARKNFKEPVPIASDSGTADSSGEETAEVTLSEIRNFIVSDIWNVGFVDIDSYIKSGTSSTGQTLDIDFTIDQLGKTMVKKAEYDTYMNGLDAKYDSIKQIWIKLSAEIDRLYKQVQDEHPTAKAADSGFDVGILSQYMNAFIDEVDELKE